MKKILTATLSANGTTDKNGRLCEWDWAESSEVEYGNEWDGDVFGYVNNLDLEEGFEINGNYDGAIHNLPEDSVVVTCEGVPVEIFWAE